MMLEIALTADPEWDSRIGWLELAEAAARSAIAESAHPGLAGAALEVELSIRLSDDAEVRALNARWRGTDRATNVLAFPLADARELAAASAAVPAATQTRRAADRPALLLGDVVLARGVCAAEALERAIPLEQHAAHLMVHGTLHLVGHDHRDEQQAADMEAREVRALARLGIADPYGERM